MNTLHPTILIVDDDPSLRKLLSLRLNANHYRVVEASSGKEALTLIAHQNVHAVITDLRMDGMDGMALFESLSASNPSLPVIILTAHGTIPDAVTATQKGVFGYLTKPFDSKQLLDLLAQAVQIGNPRPLNEAGEDDWRRDIICHSQIMEEVLEQARRAALTDASILIQSESGTGKELLARAIHRASRRNNGPFVAVNCSAIPEQLLESELFGHVKGAFTGASESRKGLFQEANGGTLFLDEIGDMPLPFQAKLLRALQEREVRPVGANRATTIDVRVISATHCNLEQAVACNRFREDLYYRLNVILLELPPLRLRPEDIQLLATHFLRHLARRDNEPAKVFSPEAMELLAGAAWPGNIRQLQNVVEQTHILSSTNVISASHVSRALREKSEELLPLVESRDRFEHEYLVRLLKITAGNVSQAARIAQRNRSEFYKLLGRHHLNPALFRQACDNSTE